MTLCLRQQVLVEQGVSYIVIRESECYPYTIKHIIRGQQGTVNIVAMTVVNLR